MIVSRSFPRAVRLLDGPSYDRVFASPRRRSDNNWTVLARASNRSLARLGLAISRRRARRAVDRNRLKRVARESFRHLKTELAGLDIVVMNRSGAVSSDNAHARASLDRLLLQLSTRTRS